MSFEEIQFPADISYGARGGPEYSTDIVEMFSGKEQRNINWSQARARYTVSHGVKTPVQPCAYLAIWPLFHFVRGERTPGGNHHRGLAAPQQRPEAGAF